MPYCFMPYIKQNRHKREKCTVNICMCDCVCVCVYVCTVCMHGIQIVLVYLGVAQNIPTLRVLVAHCNAKLTRWLSQSSFLPWGRRNHQETFQAGDHSHSIQNCTSVLLHTLLPLWKTCCYGNSIRARKWEGKPFKIRVWLVFAENNYTGLQIPYIWVNLIKENDRKKGKDLVL